MSRRVRDCTAAVVGGAGFLGSHLVNHLIDDRGCDVMVVDNLCVGRREFIHPRAKFEHVDITVSERQLFNIFRSYKIRFVFNYAAHPYIPLSFSRPLHVFHANATGAIHVINAAQEAGCEGVLQVSSAEVYGQGYQPGCEVHFLDGDPYRNPEAALREDAPVIPHSSYGVSKAAIDAMVQVRWRESAAPVIALRQFNCVGERETHPYVVPEIVSQLSRFDPNHADGMRHGDTVRHLPHPVTVRLGNNSARDFLYAGDAVRMAVELLEKGQFGQVYNLGSQHAVKVYDLPAMIGNHMGFAGVKVVEDPARKRPWEIWYLRSDNTKIYSVIEGRPQVTLDEALARTVAWHEKNGRRWPWEYTS